MSSDRARECGARIGVRAARAFRRALRHIRTPDDRRIRSTAAALAQTSFSNKIFDKRVYEKPCLLIVRDFLSSSLISIGVQGSPVSPLMSLPNEIRATLLLAASAEMRPLARSRGDRSRCNRGRAPSATAMMFRPRHTARQGPVRPPRIARSDRAPRPASGSGAAGRASHAR